MATTEFRSLTDRVASTLGQADARILEVPHPLGGTDESTILAWADAAVEETVRLFTQHR